MVWEFAVAPLLAETRFVPVAPFVIPWVPGKIRKTAARGKEGLKIDTDIE
jgi:hypothetical protein